MCLQIRHAKRHFIIIAFAGLYLDCVLQFLLLVVKSLSSSLFKCTKSKCRGKIPVNVEKKIFKNYSHQSYISVIWFPQNGEKNLINRWAFFQWLVILFKWGLKKNILPVTHWEEKKKKLLEDILKQWGRDIRGEREKQPQWTDPLAWSSQNGDGSSWNA